MMMSIFEYSRSSSSVWFLTFLIIWDLTKAWPCSWRHISSVPTACHRMTHAFIYLVVFNLFYCVATMNTIIMTYSTGKDTDASSLTLLSKPQNELFLPPRFVFLLPQHFYLCVLCCCEIVWVFFLIHKMSGGRCERAPSWATWSGR